MFSGVSRCECFYTTAFGLGHLTKGDWSKGGSLFFWSYVGKDWSLLVETCQWRDPKRQKGDKSDISAWILAISAWAEQKPDGTEVLSTEGHRLSQIGNWRKGGGDWEIGSLDWMPGSLAFVI
jgi:hypothetical protein